MVAGEKTKTSRLTRSIEERFLHFAARLVRPSPAGAGLRVNRSERERKGRAAPLGGCDFFVFRPKVTLKTISLDTKKSLFCNFVASSRNGRSGRFGGDGCQTNGKAKFKGEDEPFEKHKGCGNPSGRLDCGQSATSELRPISEGV
jgi:hypothetical protein